MPKILQILGLQPRISKVFLDHQNNFFSHQVRKILVTKYHFDFVKQFTTLWARALLVDVKKSCIISKLELWQFLGAVVFENVQFLKQMDLIDFEFFPSRKQSFIRESQIYSYFDKAAQEVNLDLRNPTFRFINQGKFDLEHIYVINLKKEVCTYTNCFCCSI